MYIYISDVPTVVSTAMVSTNQQSSKMAIAGCLSTSGNQ